MSEQTIDVFPGAQSVSRAIALLKAFEDTQPEWSLGDLSGRLGLNKTTTHRLLAALEAEGLVTQSESTAQYRLGSELIALGGCALRANELRTLSRPVLEALAMESGETTTLEILSRRQIMILDEVSNRHPMGMSQHVGSRLPIHATSTGKLLLAHQPEEARDLILAQPLARLTPKTITDPERLRAEMDDIRAQGYATADGELDVGFVAVAAPIYDAGRRVIAALSAGGPGLRLSTERLPSMVASVLESARSISRQLRYRNE